MAHYAMSLDTPWSAERAFKYLADLAHFADWDPGVKKSVAVNGTGPGIGAAWDVTVGGVGRDITLRYVISEMQQDRRVEVRAESSTLRSVDVMTFVPQQSGCTVTYDATLETLGVLKVISPVLALSFKRIGDRAAGGLRRALESTN